MNLCGAGILTIDLFLLDYIFPSAKLSDADRWYIHQGLLVLICSLAHKIVMSIPSLYKAGAVFLLFPSRQAAKVLGPEHRQYIVRMLMRIAAEIPVAMAIAASIQDLDG